jgi:tetratricopeptide (TPR) repeat protein
LLAIEPAVRGEHSDDLGAWLTAMAEIERTLGEGALAERFHREACEYQAAKWGESSLAYAAQLGNLAVVVLEAGRASDALQMFERVRSIRAEQAHLESMEDARLSFNLANAYNKLGRLEDCATEFARALAIAKRLNGESPSTARAAAGMGAALFKSGRLEEAERALREALELNRQFLPERGLQSIEAPLWLARTLAKRGANDEAAELFADVLRRIEGDPGTRAELRSKIEGECADVLEALGRGDEAREHRERGERALQSTP